MCKRKREEAIGFLRFGRGDSQACDDQTAKGSDYEERHRRAHQRIRIQQDENRRDVGYCGVGRDYRNRIAQMISGKKQMIIIGKQGIIIK